MIFDYFIPLIGRVFSSALCSSILYPILILAFLACIPCILRYFLFRR